MNILPETWYCGGCDEPHATEADAGDCCGHPPAFGFLCPMCGLGLELEADALACCNWEGTRRGYRTVKDLIEQAGQIRINLEPPQ